MNKCNFGVCGLQLLRYQHPHNTGSITMLQSATCTFSAPPTDMGIWVFDPHGCPQEPKVADQLVLLTLRHWQHRLIQLPFRSPFLAIVKSKGLNCFLCRTGKMGILCHLYTKSGQRHKSVTRATEKQTETSHSNLLKAFFRYRMRAPPKEP